jgi:hypothetical protein
MNMNSRDFPNAGYDTGFLAMAGQLKTEYEHAA